MAQVIRWVLACLLAFAGMDALAIEYRLADDPVPVPLETLIEGATPVAASGGLSYLAVVDALDLSKRRPAWSRRVAYDVVHESGLADAGRFSIGFQPAYQDVVLHAVDVWRDGRRIDRRGDSRIEVLRRESGLESGLLDGGRTLSVTIPDVRVGDRIEYRYTIHGYNPVFGRGYHDYWMPRYGVPVALREVGIVHPDGLPLRFKVDAPGFEPEQGTDGGLRWWRVRARDVAAVDDEDSVPGSHDALGRIDVSTATGWRDVALWALPLYPGRFADRAMATELANRLRLDPMDAEGSLERAVAFVQGDVRYTGLDMGVNSHAPNRPELVVQRLFGDCKDKAQLLVALLHEAGIRAEPVLVNTELHERTAERLPSPLAFDHVIVRAHLPQGEVWIDPTRERERGAFAGRAPLDLRVGLPVVADATGLVDIPYPFPERPEVEVEQRLEFVASPPQLDAAFAVETRYGAAQAGDIRDRFRAVGAGKIGEGYLSYMRGYYEGLEADGDPVMREEGQEIVVAERYRLRWDSEDEGSAFGIIPFQLLDWTPRLADKPRRMPLALSGPRFARHTVRSHHPEGWTIAVAHERVENPWFRFDRDVSVNGDGELVIVAEWRRLADEIPADGYARVRKDLLKVRDLLQYDVDLEANWRLFGTGAADWAWPVAALVLGALSLGLAWWQRQRWAACGMLYRPRVTVATRMQDDGLRIGLAVGLCAVLAELLLERGGALYAKPLAVAVGGLLTGLIGLGLRWLFLSWVLRLTMRALGHDVEAQAMRRGYGLALAPMGLFTLLALVALGFHPEWLDAEMFAPEQLPSLLVAVLLLLVGLGWWLLALAGACAGLAGTRMRRGLLIVAISVAPLVVLALLVALALSLR